MRQIGAWLDPGHRLFVHVADERAVGFLLGSNSSSPLEGSIDLLAVDPLLRGRVASAAACC